MAASEAESPLSSLESDDDMVEDTITTPNRSSRPSIDTHGSHDPDALMPPSKRRKTGNGGAFSTFNAQDRAASSQLPEPESELELSEDSDGSAPGSPSLDEFAMRADQITACQWEGCPAGDLGNSDDLVNHVQTDHIAPKRARYTCEWGECARKGTAHPSGYALKAHMRSHTKEKPFFCHLPECDRSFTRSDALAKHMRTVHEPEPPKASTTNANPIDPATGLPKKGPKIRLMNGGKGGAAAAKESADAAAASAAAAASSKNSTSHDPSPANDNIQYIPACHPVTGQPGFMITYPPDIIFTQFESEIPANQLMRLLRRQIHWAQNEGLALKTEVEALEREKRREWAAKEVLLEGVMDLELTVGQQNGHVPHELLGAMEKDVEGAAELQWSQRPAWKDRPIKPRAIAAAAADVKSEDGVWRKERAGSEDMDVEDAIERAASEDADRDAGAAQEKSDQADRDDEMAAIGVLMGLSAGS